MNFVFFFSNTNCLLEITFQNMKNLNDSPQFPNLLKFESIVSNLHMTWQSKIHIPLSYRKKIFHLLEQISHLVFHKMTRLPPHEGFFLIK